MAAVAHVAIDESTVHVLWTDLDSGDVLHAERSHGGSWTEPDVGIPTAGGGVASQGGLEDRGYDDDDDGTTRGGDGQEDDDDAGGDGAKFDTPNGTGGELPEPTYGCAKFDFVFVVDSSASMLDEQENLQTSFPQFIAAIEDTLMTEDFHRWWPIPDRSSV